MIELQKMLNLLYSDETKTIDKAKDVLFSSQHVVYGFLKNVVSQLAEDEALAILAEVDHRLTFPHHDFSFTYDTENCGSSESPYTLGLRYGDPDLGYVHMTVNELSQ